MPMSTTNRIFGSRRLISSRPHPRALAERRRRIRTPSPGAPPSTDRRRQRPALQQSQDSSRSSLSSSGRRCRLGAFVESPQKPRPIEETTESPEYDATSGATAEQQHDCQRRHEAQDSSGSTCDRRPVHWRSTAGGANCDTADGRNSDAKFTTPDTVTDAASPCSGLRGDRGPASGGIPSGAHEAVPKSSSMDITSLQRALASATRFSIEAKISGEISRAGIVCGVPFIVISTTPLRRRTCET